jgi:hypothetical protein
MSFLKFFGAGSTDPTIKISQSDLHLSGAPTHFTGNSVQTLLSAVYLLAGIVAVIAIIIGAIRFITAGGDSGQVSSAKNVITYAVIGLVVVIAAAAITNFVITTVGG